MVTRKTGTDKTGGMTAAFPVVGLGASAGGLEAFEQFFLHLPADSGMAFVLVPHLDPGHSSILTEILQRTTAIPVVEAEDQMVVEPNQVYVIPPNRDMALFHGALQLSVPEQPRGQRMPIDAFLRSLAEDQGEMAVGIVLSGTGSDGTLGLRAIFGNGGLCMVQQPDTAKYDGMPASAIRAGYATRVLPVADMPQALLADIRHAAHRREAAEPPASAGGMRQILMLLRSATGHDFSQYKRSTVGRRIERRMARNDIDDIDLYVRHLKEHPAELQSLFKELLINVTSFFRDPEAFAALKREALPLLLADRPDGAAVRVWVAGVATGEEAYSLAMLLREVMDETHCDGKVQIYGTDIDDDAIAIARAGLYPSNIAQDVSPERLRRFFVKEETGYRVKKEIREMVVFAIQNVIKDPPFTRLDLLSCRNLMIYLEPELQDRLLPAFHYALRRGGVLFLSPSESIGNHNELFAPINRKWKLYHATESAASSRAVMANGLSWAAENASKPPEGVMKKTKETDFADLTRRALLQFFAPTSVLTDLKGDIVYVHGDTTSYLRPPPGHTTVNVIDMARDELQLEQRAAVHLAASQGTPTMGREVAVAVNGSALTVSIDVSLLPDPASGQKLLLVSFREAALAPASKPGRRKQAVGSIDPRLMEDLKRELVGTKETLRATIEEQQASTEELKSANEEMQSTNEELQSTNEELETSKEELQSVNEELMTVNAELQAKIEQLAGMQNDMKNLLDNINIGTIFLDEHLAIRRFTREATRVYRLVASDAGRPLGDIKSNLEGGDLLTEAEAVLETLVPCEREMKTVGGNWYLARIQPYRTLDNVIEGLVLTFTDISKRVAAETAGQEARELAEVIADTVRQPLLVLDSALKVVSASGSFYRRFQIAPTDAVGHQFFDLSNRQWDTPALRSLLDAVSLYDQPFEGYAVDHSFPGSGRHRVVLNGRRIIAGTGGRTLILLEMETPQITAED